jgi:multiple sugar transport system permease protein
MAGRIETGTATGTAVPTALGEQPAAIVTAPPRYDTARLRSRHVVGRSLALMALVVAALFFIVPVVWLLFAPTKTDHALVADSPFAFGSFAQVTRTWHNLYQFESGAILTWMRNSAVLSVGGVALAVAVAIPAGYGLAVTRFIGRKTLLIVTLIVMLVPANATVLPLFLGMSDVHLIGNALSVILPFGFFPFGVYLAYIYFETTIPNDLLAAARVDGCSEWKTFRYVAAPLAMPVIALVAFFNFVGNWNNFFLPYVMLPQSNQFTSSVGLADLLSNSPAFNPSAGGQDLSVLRPEVALAVLFTVAPVLVVFLFAQRALVRGLLAGATKE